jgi:exopolysaccharide biosynthesis polyprenyl glycosylphosphotransferase
MLKKAAKFPPLLLLIIDAFAINIAFVLAYYIRFEWFLGKSAAIIPQLGRFYYILIFVTFLWLALFKLLGLYDKRDITSTGDEASSIIGATIAGSLLLFALLFLYRGFWFSRALLIYAMMLCSALMIFSRYILNGFQRELYKRGVGVRRTLILGAGEIGQGLAFKMLSEKEIGYKAVAFLDDDPDKMNKDFQGIPVIGSIISTKNKIRELNIDEVILATGKLRQQKVLDIIMECESEGVEFKLVPGILELIASRISTDDIGGIPLLTIKEIGLQGFNALIKRISDVTVSLAALLLISPLMILAAAAIKLESRGPVFFSQERTGKDGKIFNLYKFRSMVQGAESQFEKIVAQKGGNIIRFKAKDDPRITRIGKVIRKLSIDELPQLINVLIGDMSLVGPRPPVPIEVDRYSAWHKKRLRVRPGITGLWQVSGRSELPFEDMIRLDIYYIENWSLWMDFRIVLRTIPTVIFGSGAY